MADAGGGYVAQPDRGRVGLLVSVRSLAEAERALTGGADLIDMKEPSRGALGAVDGSVLRSVVRRMDSLRPVSATIGDPSPDLEVMTARAETVAAAGPDYVKVGLARDSGTYARVEALAPMARSGVRLVAVLLADNGLPETNLLDRLQAAGFAGAMLDTGDKASGSLTALYGVPDIAAFCRMVRRRGLLLGLAGSLRISDIPRLAPLRPDYLGFRGALCAGGRTGVLDEDRVREALRVLTRSCDDENMQAVSG